MENGFINEPIDPERVIPDPAPETTPDEPIDPARVRLDPYFPTTKSEISRIREAFAGNPLAVFEDETDRSRLEIESRKLDNPETFKKRYALAAYFSRVFESDFKFVLANLDQFITRYNYDEPQSVEAAYKSVAEIFYPPSKKPFSQRVGPAVYSGAGRVAEYTFNTLGFLGRFLAAGAAAKAKAQLNLIGYSEEAAQIDPTAIGNRMEKGIRGVYRKHYAETTNFYSQEMQLPDDWMTNSDGFAGWIENSAIAMISYAPEFAAQSGIAVTGGITPLAFTYGVNGYYDIRDNYPEMSEWKAVVYGVGVGLINGMLEKVTLGIIDGKVSKKVAEEGIKKGLLAAAKHYGWNIAKEGAAEGLEEFSQNIFDIAMGLRGDISQWSGTDYRRELFRGVPESAFIGGISVIPFAENSRRMLREVATRHEQQRVMLDEEITRLRETENLTPDDEVALARLQKLSDAGNIADAESVARNIVEEEFIRNNADADPSPETVAIESEAWEGATEEEIRKAAEAERNIRNFSRLPHNPQDTVDAVSSVAAQFRGVNFEIVMNPEEYPAEVRTEIETRFGSTRIPKAFFFRDTVWIDAGRVRPSEVPRTVLHEVIGHNGLRLLFPNDGKLNSILDNIYREHFNEPLFDRVAELNFPTRERVAEIDPETGETLGSGRISLETEEDQRIAAEEYVARIAETKAPKPNWWKEFLQSIRMWMAEHLPFTREVRMTDREIETLLARSARAARRKRRGYGKVIAPEAMIRFRVNENGETIFGISGRRGDFTAREILEDKAISENTPILTSEGSEVWGEITPEMAEAGKELGLEALPIKLLKGKHFGNHTGFGLEHLWNQHGVELEGRGYDLSDFLTGIFGKPNQIYASKQGDNIRLELVTKSKPRNIGVLELRKEDGFYSVVTAFPIDQINYKLKGKQVWRYTASKPNKISQEGSPVISAGKQRTSPLEPLSADNAADAARDTGSKPDINITSSGEKSSGEGIRFSVDSQIDTPEFKRWFGKSQMVDENGEPRIFYHGTNEDFYTFDAAAPHTHDAGFYGQGFYFDFWDWEAEYYGNRVLPVYLRVEKPFDFSKMLSYKGKSVQYVGADSLCFLYNIAKKFPELEGKVSMPSIGKWENDVLVEKPALTFREYIDLVEDTEKRLSFCEVGEENGTRVDIEFDTHEFDEWNGEKFPVTITIMRNVLQSDTPENRREMLSVATFIALREAYNISVDYHPEGIMTRIPEITDAIKQQGYDGIIQSPDGDEVVVFSPNQIKSATDNVGSFDPVNPDIRFAASEFSADEESDIVALLRPFVGPAMTRSDAEIVDYLRRHGVEIDEPAAHFFHKSATDENRAAARRRNEKQRSDWLFENVPVWRNVVEATGKENFKITPSMRFRGEEMSGTFITRKNETGIASDELAQSIVRRYGGDANDVEQEIIDFFRDLKKPDLYKMYSDWKKQTILGEREIDRRMREEWKKQEQARIEDEVVSLIERGNPVSEEWAGENRPLYRELHRRLFPEQEAPAAVRPADIEAINAALAQESGNAATYAQAYRSARQKSYEEFSERLRNLREKALTAKADALKLQRDALAFAEKHLPSENRGEFSRAIVKLLEYPTAPSARFPEGRRAAEFRKLFENILDRSAAVRRENAISEIREMLDAAKIKRNYRGIPTSILPSEQQKVDRIRKIVSLDLAAVANLVEFNNEQLSSLDANEENSRAAELLIDDNLLLTTFGNLEHQSADSAEAAAAELRKLISGGKAAFAEKLAQRKSYLDGLRRRVVEDATFGKNRYADRGDAKKHTDFMLKNESLGTLMRIASGRGIQDFDSTVGGELYRRVEDSTQHEQTALRRLQKKFDEAIQTICGIDSMRKKGRFFREISEVVEHTGVHKIEFSRPVATGPGAPVFEEGRRQLVSKSIPIEDYEFEGKPRKGARSILRDIDNGKRVAAVAGIPLDDVAVAFLRQQVADFDAGLQQSYEIFNEESDDANFNRMIEEERAGGRAVVFGHNPQEQSRTVEVPLSQGAALQILLTWEQEHYQPNMKWNGWTEESIAELRNFIKPEVLKLGYWMRDEIARNRPELDRKVFDRYGAHLPENDSYFPAAFRGGRSRTVRTEGELGRGAGSMSINPGFLIARKFHLKPVDLDADAFSSFLGNQLDQSHFLAWSDVLRDLRGVYGNSMVQKAINDNFGKNVTDNLVERIETIVRGGGKFSGEYVARLLSRIYRHWVPAKIALNPSSAIKQIFGSAAYMNHIPVADFCKNLAVANFTNPEFREFVKFARNTDYMKNRLSGGLDRDLQYLMNYTRDSKLYSPFTDVLMRVGTLPTRWSDAWSSLHGGFAVYKYNLEQAKKSGMTQSEAHDAAIRAWMRATDETQQSGALKDQNYFQANQGLYRYLTAFLTNPIQVMNLQLQTVNELRYGSDKAAAAKKLGKQILVNHLILPSLMLFTNDILRAGFNVADWWDETEFEDYLLAWGLGQFEAVFLLGKMTTSLYDAWIRKRGWGAAISAAPLVDDLRRDGVTVGKFIDGDISETDLMDGIRAIGDVGMLAGMADGRIGAAGAMLSAIGTQGKRVLRMILGE